ncbi:hypothetical protein [Pseudomonas nicosulfuronedens]
MAEEGMGKSWLGYRNDRHCAKEMALPLTAERRRFGAGGSRYF